MADTELKVKISAEDNAGGTFSSLSGKLGGLGNAAATAGKVIGGTLVAAVGALGVFAVASFKAAVDAEAEMQQATQALANTFDNFSSKDVANMRKQMEDGQVSFDNLTKAMGKSAEAALKLGFDDEEASKAFAKLFSVTKDVKKSQEELKIAMDLAAYSGRSLEEATSALTMVHAGGTRVLKEFGIEVQNGTTAAQALTMVQDRVTGSAEAMANTTQGKLKILNESWNNLKETVGATLIEAIGPFINKLAEFTSSDKFQEWLKKTGEYAKYLATLFTVEIPQAFNNAVTAVDSFIEKAKQNAVVILIWDTLKSAIMQVWDSIQNALLPAINQFWQTIQPFMPEIKEFGEILAKVFGVILLSVLLVTIKAVGGLLAVTVEVFAKFIELGSWITGVFIKVWESLTTALSKVIDFFQKIIDLAKQAASTVSNFGGSLGSAYSNAGANIRQTFGGSMNDGVVQNGKIITTHPDDFIIATKNPASLGMGGGGVTINVYGDVSGQELVRTVKEAIMNDLSINGKYSF